MKKSILLLTAIVAVACMSCKKESKEEAVTKISFKESSVVMTVGDTVRFSVLWEPATVAAPTCTWTSSNEEVATVDANGNVAALSKGTANITAKTGELSAVCQVEVKSWMEAVEFSQIVLIEFGEDPVNDSVYELTLTSGVDVKCRAYAGLWYVIDSDIDINEEGYFMGAGFVAELDAPVLVITECEIQEYIGYYISSSQLITQKNSSTDSVYYAEAGRIDDLTAYATAIPNATTDEQSWNDYVATIQGAKISYIDFDESTMSLYLGLWDEGIIMEDEEEFYCKQNIAWFNDDSFYGLKIAEDGKSLVEPLELVTTNIYYENLPEEESTRYEAKKFNAGNMKNMTVSRELTQKVVTALQHK